MLYLRIRRKELIIRSYLCRLLSAVNVMLNLSIATGGKRGRLLRAINKGWGGGGGKNEEKKGYIVTRRTRG